MIVLKRESALDGTLRVKVKGAGRVPTVLASPIAAEKTLAASLVDPTSATLPVTGISLADASVSPTTDSSVDRQKEKKSRKTMVVTELTGWISASLLTSDDTNGEGKTTKTQSSPDTPGISTSILASEDTYATNRKQSRDVKQDERTYGFSCQFDRLSTIQ